MLIGQTIVGDGSTRKYSTPWMPRGGDGVTSVLEVIGIEPQTKVTAKVFHKNSSDTGSGSENTTGSAVRPTAGVSSFRCTGLKQLVRYELSIDPNDIPAPKMTWAHVRMLAPSWEWNGAQDV